MDKNMDKFLSINKDIPRSLSTKMEWKYLNNKFDILIIFFV